MIALAFLAVTMLGVMQLFGVSIHQNAFARYNTMALVVAQEKLEQLQTEFNNELENGTISSDLSAGSHGPETLTLYSPSGSGSGDRVFQISWEVVVSAPSKTVTVSVSPDVANNFETKTLSMTALYSR